MKLAMSLVQLLVLVLAAPALRGIIAKFKARIQRRQGASIFRPYADLLKLFRKENLALPNASPIFLLAPVVVLATVVIAAAFIPVLSASSLLEARTDFFIFVYLLALGRFFISLGALDAGSSFGGMGASREALVSVLAEAPLLLALTSLAMLSKSLSLAEISRWTVGQDFFGRLRRYVEWKQDWNLSPVMGVFAAAATASRIAGLSRDQISNALGIASMHSSGTMEVVRGKSEPDTGH